MAILSLTGCATSTYSIGKNFASENVSQIVKGKTTKEEITSMFGEPFSKAVISASEEKWTYMHSEGTSKAQSYLISMEVKTTGTQKTLDVLITHDVVANFTFTEGQNPYTMKVN